MTEKVRRALSYATFAVLLGFHAVLLVLHVVNGRLFEPATSVRWVIGAFLFAGFIALRRLGLPVIWGRKAVVLWLLVILLHCHAALAAPVPGDSWPTLPAVLVTAVSKVAASIVLLGLLFLPFLSSARQPRVYVWRRQDLPAVWRATSALTALQFSPRPPPLR